MKVYKNITGDTKGLIEFIAGLKKTPFRISKQNIKKHTIEIISKDGRHASCGLLITHNGYFITCDHCLRKGGDIKDRMVRTSDGKEYRIDFICGYSSSRDVLLGKVNMPGECTAIKYRICDFTNIKHQVYIDLYTLRDGRLVTKNGYTSFSIENSTKGVRFLDHIIYKGDTCRGDSGGIVASIDGELIGLHANSFRYYKKSCAQLYHVLVLIKKYCS